MKILSIFNVCLAGALMLALFLAWSATAPQLISGYREVAAGCDDCDDIGRKKCKALLHFTCTDRYFGCVDEEGDWECYIPNPTPAECLKKGCVPRPIELCVPR